MEIDLVVPVKSLRLAKSRLRGAADGGTGDADAHAELVLAVVLDTVTAAVSASGVRSLLVVSPDAVVAAALAAEGVECTAEGADLGLNEALRHGEELLRARNRDARVGALQADLPALRPADLADALAEAGQRRAYCADRQGTGTTLLVSAPGGPLAPSFGPGSAAAHAASGAAGLTAALPTLRCDVDTGEDLAAARRLGLGPRTSVLVESPCRGSVGGR